MCGIAGLLDSRNASCFSDLKVSLDFLSHRGPDDSGCIEISLGVGSLFLGHTRLSIIDLSGAGHQPMTTEDGRWTIVFNGEIYNYRELRGQLAEHGHCFKTHSDTEVLLAAWIEWGKSCLDRLVGMFAFAIYDNATKKLSLVRDAFGIKPLYYTNDSASGVWAFASEVPALLALVPDRPILNLQRAFDYFVYGSYDDQPATFFQGIEQLSPGHYLEYSLDADQCGKPVRWWKPSIKERSDLTFTQAAEELRERFLNNIRLHLRSDVPLGAALSGGLDSSAVVCAMRHVEPAMPIHTFSFVSPGSASDEEHWADLVNETVGAIPHKVQVRPEELADDLDSLIKSQGEPFGSTSIYAQYRVFRAAREAGITVTLDGQGADELLAGYDGYPQARLRSLLDQNHFGEAFHFLQAWRQSPGRGRRRALAALMTAMAPEQASSWARKLRYGANASWLDFGWLASRGVNALPHSPLSMLASEGRKGRRLSSALCDALTGAGLASLLRHGDRNSMHWSIESRVPFLTTGFADYMLSLPEGYLLSVDGQTKHVFRAAMRGIVPDEILDRRDKIGFATPEQAWLKVLAPQIEGWLSAAGEIPFLHHGQLTSMVQEMISGKRRFTWQAWRVINFCRWMQIFQPVIPA